MNLPRPYSLQSKFVTRLIVSIILISIVNLSALYFFMQSTLQDEVSTRASIVLKQVDAVQKYVQTKLRPKMLEVLPQSFVLEAMSSSYISRSVMEKAHSDDSDYVYRRVAINARNPVFEANEVEQELIAHFRENLDKDIWQGLKYIDDQRVFVMARPVRFVESCLLCHGKEADAPPELGGKYGTRGFDHSQDSIDGMDFVGIPTDRYTAKSNADFSQYVVLYLLISIFILFMIYLTFQRVVLVNFRTLTSQFRKNFHDQKGVELLLKVEHGDEIEEMIEGMEGLSQHLFETDQRLKEYTADLEREVDRRTEQLSRENDTHKKDLNLLVQVLGALRISRNRPQLWRSVLPLLAERVLLIRASYICTFSGNQDFTWQEGAKPPVLPANYVQLLLQPKLLFSNNTVFVPVGGSDENIDGLLFLERPAHSPFTPDEGEMLTAVGRQLGIAAENLAALDSILNQSENLGIIFEGVPDPLLLLDRSGSVIMANDAAKRLTEELACHSGQRSVLDCLVVQEGENGMTADQLTALSTREVVLDNGRSFIVNSISLVREENKTARTVVAIQEDTDKKKMLHQFVQAEKLGTVGKLAAGLAHELNNPLGIILCYAELLKKALDGSQHQSDIDIIIKHIRQAQTVLLDLLNFARPKVSTDRQTVIGEVVENVVGVFRVQAAKKGVTLSCRRAVEAMVVRVEPQVVEHIILNLLLNALDALPEKGGMIDVEIAGGSGQRGLRLSVTDNGSGIDPAILPSIFDPFFTTKDVNKGSGLGLAVIYGYMLELGGTVEARNRPEGGAIFDLYFPVAEKLEE